jgi:hypothetical protein
VYLDFIIFGVIWAYAQEPLFAYLPHLKQVSFLMKFVTFTLAEVLLYKIVQWNPGNYLLSIRYLDVRTVAEANFVLPGRRVAVVDARIKDNESWLTILFAVLFMNEGLKSFVRWSMWTPPVPLFGSETDAVTSALWLIAVGAVECCIAFLIFRLRRPAFTAGVLYVCVSLVSTVLSWRLWDPWVEEMVLRRRAYMGMAVRPGEVEFMQKIAPEGLIAALVVYLILLLLIRKKIVFGKI